MKAQSIAYLLSESEHIYWILYLEVEVHSKWVLWLSRMQGQLFLRSGRVGNIWTKFAKTWVVLWDALVAYLEMLMNCGCPLGELRTHVIGKSKENLRQSYDNLTLELYAPSIRSTHAIGLG